MNEEARADIHEASLAQLVAVGSSIGGARAKAVIALGPNGEIRSGQISGLKRYEYGILKFDGLTSEESEDGGKTYYTRIEYAYYLAAVSCGIEMMPSRLFPMPGGHYHFLTERFDRTAEGKKTHMLSLAGLAGFDFRDPGAHSYEEVAGIIDRLHGGKKETEQLFRRMVFNAVAQNDDDHVKNISFLMDRDGSWRLAPAYDLSFSHNENGQWSKHRQMTINGKLDGFVDDDFVRSAQRMGLRKDWALSVLREERSVLSSFVAFGDKAFLPPSLSARLKDEFLL
ncbi:MAG: HipA domain-containing protein [Bacilli bacterium]|nr:HipA domain-containing protein [Bacilli bacterium]